MIYTSKDDEMRAIKGMHSELALTRRLLRNKKIKLKPTHHTRQINGWQGVGLNGNMIHALNEEYVLNIESVASYYEPTAINKALFEVKVRTSHYVYPFLCIQEVLE